MPEETSKIAACKFLRAEKLNKEEEEILQSDPGDPALWRRFLFPEKTSSALPPGFHKNLPFHTQELRHFFPEGRLSLYVPEIPEPSSPSPLILFLHGGDQSSPPDTPWKNYLGPEGSLRKFAENSPCIIAAASALPAADGKRWNRTNVKKYMTLLLEELEELFNIDPDRKILAGYSMGGFGTYHSGQILHDRFSCILLGAGGWWAADFGNFTGTELFILHGRNDCSPRFKGALKEARHHDWCGFSFGEAAHRILQEKGIPHTTLFHNGGHSLYEEEAANVMERFFLLAPGKLREPYPSKVYLSTPAGSCDPLLEDHLSSFYCDIVSLETGDIELTRIRLSGPNVAEREEDIKLQTYQLIPQIQSGGSLTAKHIAKNHFRITTKNISCFHLWLTPEKTDFSRKVLIDWNGEKREYEVKPSLLTLLKSYLRRKDEKMLFPAVLECKWDH